MECLGSTIMYLLRGKLPWQGLKANKKIEKYKKENRKNIEETKMFIQKELIQRDTKERK